MRLKPAEMCALRKNGIVVTLSEKNLEGVGKLRTKKLKIVSKKGRGVEWVDVTNLNICPKKREWNEEMINASKGNFIGKV